MAMKPSLVLKLGQQLRMTPQLQQAIRLLQLSTLDLQQEIQEALDSNIMLEEINGEAEQADQESAEPALEDYPDDMAAMDESQGTSTDDRLTADTQTNNSDAEADFYDPELDGDYQQDTGEQLASDTLGDELPIDSLWEDTWDSSSMTSQPGNTGDSDDDYIDTRNVSSISLQTHLEDQLNLRRLSDVDQLIAMAIVDGLDSNGILTVTLEDILLSIPPQYDCEMDEVVAVLHLIQHLDPVGVAARDLRECLLIQLNALPEDTAWRREAIIVVSDHISSLANRDYALLLRKTRLKENELREVVALIQTLSPRPGADIAPSTTEYIEPDVLVSKKNGQWTVELNPKSAPKIQVNQQYAAMIKRADTSSDNTYLKNNLQEARWFIKSLQQRNETLLKVSTKIVEYQRGFLEYGEKAMKPLVLHEIATAVDLHESTISRVTTQKYMHTPAGVFELKYFFSSHVNSQAGGEVSSTAIRALIKQLVTDENPKKPLSDSKIVKLLAAQDITVARRTIAKYRESLQIRPSNERKQLI